MGAPGPLQQRSSLMVCVSAAAATTAATRGEAAAEGQAGERGEKKREGRLEEREGGKTSDEQGNSRP